MQLKGMLDSTALINLARDSTPEARAELAAATADRLLNDPNETSAAEVELFGAVLTMLYPFARQDVRERLSAALALADWAPPSLVREIARDNEQVALQMISFCPVLDDEGLVDIVRTCGLEHRKTVASRDNISETVSHELVDLNDVRVLAPLIDNATARLASEDFQQALNIASDRPDIVDAMAMRPDLPASLVANAYAVASKDARESISSRLPAQLSARLSRLADIVCADAIEVAQEAEKSQEDLAASRAAAGKPATQLPSPGALLGVLMRGDRKAFLRGIAVLTGVPGAAFNKRMRHPDVEFIATFCKAAGYEQASVCVIADAFRTDGPAWTKADDKIAAMVWMRHSRASARQALVSIVGS
jgi:uncharacterized protein (DUF2336 family)